jgi:hypothetical protein
MQCGAGNSTKWGVRKLTQDSRVGVDIAIVVVVILRTDTLEVLTMKNTNVYLQYMTHTKRQSRLTKFAFQKICNMFDWKADAILEYFTTAGWKFDPDYGFTFEEVVEHMFIALPQNNVASKMAGYNQACEGRR